MHSVYFWILTATIHTIQAGYEGSTPSLLFAADRLTAGHQPHVICIQFINGPLAELAYAQDLGS